MRRLLLSLITLLPFTTFAQEATLLSLEESIDYALKNQVKIKNSILDLQTAIAKNREITGQALPNLKATGGITYAPLVAAFLVPDFISGAIKGGVQEQYLTDALRNRPVGTLPLAFQPKWTTTGQAELSQLLFEPNILVALQGRKVLEVMAQKSIELSEQDVKVGVIKAYNDVLIAKKRIELLDQNLVRIEQIERETRITYEAGLAEKIDVDRIKVSLNNLRTEKIRTIQLVDLAYMALKFQMGMPLENPIVLTDSLNDSELDQRLLSESLTYGDRKEFQLAELQRKVSQLDLKRHKMGSLPTLSLFANYGYTLYNDTVLFDTKKSDWQDAAMVGVRLSVPLFDGFQRKNRVKQASYTLQKAENNLENLKLSLNLEKENARITYASNIRALANQRENMALASEVYRMAQVKYKEGVGSSLEVINAESALKEAQTNYFSALYDAITARTNLQKALGEL
jgi:outer membrane protein TolC